MYQIMSSSSEDLKDEESELCCLKLAIDGRESKRAVLP